MAVKANILFLSILFLSILFLLLYKPFGLIDRAVEGKIPMVEFYDFNTYTIDDIVKKRINSLKALQYADVIQFDNFMQYEISPKGTNILRSTKANYYENSKAEFFGEVSYKIGTDSIMTTTYAKYDMIKELVLGNKRFHFKNVDYDMYGSGFLYHIKAEKFDASNIELEVR